MQMNMDVRISLANEAMSLSSDQCESALTVGKHRDIKSNQLKWLVCLYFEI